MTHHSANPDYDIAVIGGGIAGIYTGWRLLSADSASSPVLHAWARARGGKLKVAVFEGSQRIGGRLLSAQPPGMSSTICEIGGMRYVSSQTHVRSLIENELKLARHEQAVDEPQNLAYLRGTRLRVSQLNNPSGLPYNLDWTEQQWLSAAGDSPNGLISWSLTKAFPQLADQNLRGDSLLEFLKSASFDGIPLYQHGFWNLLSRVMSSEAYQLCRTMVGYDCLGNNGNAVDLIRCYFDFVPGVKYFLLDNGYEEVPWQLEKRFGDAGGEVITGRWLSGFDTASMPDNSTGFCLRFVGADAVNARAVILAMPRHAIESLRPEGAILDPSRAPKFRSMLGSVRKIPLYKLFLGYPYPWWTQAGVEKGRSLTDIPLRQCYYWAANPVHNPQPQQTNAMIMIYDDAGNVDFWGGLRESARKGAHIPDHLERLPVFRSKVAPAPAAPAQHPFQERLRRNWRDHEAPANMVAEAHRQLREMHNAHFAPEPTEAAFMDWTEEPYGAAVHLWDRNYKSWVIMKEMIQPVSDLPCYVCGEAYSLSQTWAEGALETAELLLQGKFGLAAPKWLDANPPEPAGNPAPSEVQREQAAVGGHSQSRKRP